MFWEADFYVDDLLAGTWQFITSSCRGAGVTGVTGVAYEF